MIEYVTRHPYPESVIERCDPGPGLRSGIVWKGELANLQIPQRHDHDLEPVGAGRSDKYLGQGQRTDAEVVVSLD